MSIPSPLHYHMRILHQHKAARCSRISSGMRSITIDSGLDVFGARVCLLKKAKRDDNRATTLAGLSCEGEAMDMHDTTGESLNSLGRAAQTTNTRARWTDTSQHIRKRRVTFAHREYKKKKNCQHIQLNVLRVDTATPWYPAVHLDCRAPQSSLEPGRLLPPNP